MNSCVPKELSSTTPPQCVFTLRGRSSRGPMPSRQWYSSAKHPPGHRNTGTLELLERGDDIVAIARVFGIGEFSPTQIPS